MRRVVDQDWLRDADTFWGGPNDPKSNLVYKAFQDGIADGNNNHQVTHRRLGLLAGVGVIGAGLVWVLRRKR